MNFIRIWLLCGFLFCSNLCADSLKSIAIDGTSGFIGSSLVKDLDSPKLGYHRDPTTTFAVTDQVFIGEIYDPYHLRNFLNGVDVYYQMASISSVEPRNTIQEYITTNSIGPYLASRINKSMTILSMSTIAIYDVEENKFTTKWINNFVEHFEKFCANTDLLSKDILIQEVNDYISANKTPALKPNQYYGFSKLLLEKLLHRSSADRSGNIYLIRAGLIVGDKIQNRKGGSVIKNIMDSLFRLDNPYEVWSRSNFYTPIDKLKKMMLHVTNNEFFPDKFAIFDSGFVVLHQHDFVNLLLSKTIIESPNIKLVNNNCFYRDIAMRRDERLSSYYPTITDVEQAIEDMIYKYEIQ